MPLQYFNFVSAVIVRPEFESPAWNTVLFGESADVLAFRNPLMAAADIVQARYRTERFLIEVAPETTVQDVLRLGTAFQFDLAMPLYVVPFPKRDMLPPAKYLAADFITYNWMWRTMVGEDIWEEGAAPVDIDAFWEDLYARENFALFRLILSNDLTLTEK